MACQQAGASNFCRCSQDLRLSHVGQSLLGQAFSISRDLSPADGTHRTVRGLLSIGFGAEPDDPRTLVYFGEVLIYLGRRDDGLQMIEKASNLLKDQDDPDKLGERLRS